MKKVNFVEAEKIIGGTCRVCTVQFSLSGSTCNAVTTCLDKNGNVVSSKTQEVAAANCGSVNP